MYIYINMCIYKHIVYIIYKICILYLNFWGATIKIYRQFCNLLFLKGNNKYFPMLLFKHTIRMNSVLESGGLSVCPISAVDQSRIPC